MSKQVYSYFPLPTSMRMRRTASVRRRCRLGRWFSHARAVTSFGPAPQLPYTVHVAEWIRQSQALYTTTSGTTSGRGRGRGGRGRGKAGSGSRSTSKPTHSDEEAEESDREEVVSASQKKEKAERALSWHQVIKSLLFQIVNLLLLLYRIYLKTRQNGTTY